jgi:hypothetical protein
MMKVPQWLCCQGHIFLGSLTSILNCVYNECPIADQIEQEICTESFFFQSLLNHTTELCVYELTIKEVHITYSLRLEI